MAVGGFVDHLDEDVTARRLRQGLLGLAALGVAGTFVELATLRHWDDATQLIPWFAMAAMGVMVVAVAVVPSPLVLRVVRIVSVVVVLAALYGVWEHVESNHDSGPLDAVYGARWDDSSATQQWWWALTQAVGPSPLLAPAVLAQVSLCTLLATWRHPSSRGRRAAEPAT